MKDFWRAWMILIIAAVLLASSPTLAVEAPKPKKVLILYSYHKGVPWEDLVSQGIRSVFASSQAGPFQISEEYSDLVRFPKEANKSLLYQMLHLKYATQPLDVVLASGDEASQFLIEYGQELFPAVPMVIAVGEGEAYKRPSLPPRMTSVLVEEDFSGTIEVALGMLPHTRRIFMVAGSSLNDRLLEERARKQLAGFPASLEFTYLTDLAANDLLEKVSRLPPESLVLYLNVLRDAVGKPIISRDLLRALSGRANAPVFGVYDTYLGQGMVGGKITSAESMGISLARQGLRLLAGEVPADIPPAKLPNASMFDWRELKRWGLLGSPLPPGSVIKFREYSFFELYWGWVIGGIALILLEIILISFLLVHRRHRKIEEAQRRKAELALEESVTSYRRIVETANEGILVIDGSRRVTFANQKIADMLGYTPEELIGQNLDALVYSEHLEAYRLSMEKRRQGQSETYESRYLRKDGEPIWVLVSAAPILDDRRGFSGSFAMITDITQRKRADDALKESEEKFRTLFDNAADAIFILDHHYRFIEVNQAACQRLGYTREEMLKFNIQQIDAPKFAALVPQRMEELFQKGSFKGETAHQTKDGRTIPVEVNARLITLFGQPAVLTIARDITDRKRAEKALQESEVQFRTLVESAPIAIVIQTGGNIVYVNQEGMTAFGAQAKEELLGQPVLDRVPSRYHEQVKARIKQVNVERVSLRPWEYEYLKLDGKLFDVEVFSVPFTYRGDPGALVFFRDITMRKKDEEEKAKLEAQLRQAQKMEAIGTLAGGIAHDFNNILGAIMGYAELAQELARDGNSNIEELAQVLEAAERARNLVRQILTFSRKAEADLRPLSLNKCVRQTLQMLEHALPKMISIETHFAPDLRLVNADPNQMEQVLLNLATNAADAMPEGGRLVIETQNIALSDEYSRQHLEVRPGQYVLLMMSDTGHGMEACTLEHIFDPFFTTKEVGKGTGLGLATVYGIIKGHGGHIYCYSEPGMGATFKIYLPVYEAGAPAPTLEVSLPEQLLKGTETILLADDEQALRELGSRALEGMGYRVLTANNGEEALEIYRTKGEQIALVILDLGMPGMGGHKCLKEILALNPEARVVIASGYSANGQVKASLESGASGFVAKPFRRIDLLATVRQVLDR